MKTKISEKGQVTIPKAIRERHGLLPGVELEFISEGGSVRVVKAVPSDPIDRWRGRGRVAGFSNSSAYLAFIRDEDGSR